MRVAGQGQTGPSQTGPSSVGGRSVHYKWIALSNTTLGILMVTINQSILLISLPDLFRGINLNPLVPSNTSYFLWVFMGFMLVTAVLVVSLGRVGDIYGRVKMYNLGFAVFTLLLDPAVGDLADRRRPGRCGSSSCGSSRASAARSCSPTRPRSSPTPSRPNERGKAMGINGIAAVGGSFLGLILGGVLAPIEWRLVFLVSVPFGLFGTVWAYLKLRGQRGPHPGQDRLAGQRAVRRRPDRGAHRHRLLAAPLRRAPHRLDQSRGC